MTSDLQYCKNQVAEIASSIVGDRIRPLLGVRMLLPFLRQLEKEIHEDALLFLLGVDSESDALPLGAERQYWADHALHEKDRTADAYEKKVGPKIIETANYLLTQFSSRRDTSLRPWL